jgi:hypothetical protein
VRQPTPPETLLAFHAAAIAGENPERNDGNPQCGYYRMKMVKGGPWVPVRIWCRQTIDLETMELAEPETFQADVGGEVGDPVGVWSYCQPISRETYEALLAACAADQVMAAIKVPVNLAAQPVGPSRRN